MSTETNSANPKIDFIELLSGVRRSIQGKINPKYRRRYRTSDVVQESAIQLIRELTSEPEVRPVTQAWLSTIAKGNSARLANSHSAQCRTVLRSEYHSADRLEQTKAANPLQDSANREVLKALLSHIESLDEIERQIVDYHYRQGQSLNSIGKTLGFTGKQMQRQHRAIIQKLKSKMNQFDDEESHE